MELQQGATARVLRYLQGENVSKNFVAVATFKLSQYTSVRVINTGTYLLFTSCCEKELIMNMSADSMRGQRGWEVGIKPRCHIQTA